MDICHSPESGTPGAPLRPKYSTPRSGFVQQSGAANGRQPFRSEAKSHILGGCLPSLTFALDHLAHYACSADIG
jgi:hypothetical protein